MPKIKMPRSNPSLDMTPMVDLAFLLVTFFILTASFRNPEPVQVLTPSSTSEKIMPENSVLITISPEGKVFYTISGFDVRKKHWKGWLINIKLNLLLKKLRNLGK